MKGMVRCVMKTDTCAGAARVIAAGEALSCDASVQYSRETAMKASPKIRRYSGKSSSRCSKPERQQGNIESDDRQGSKGNAAISTSSTSRL